MGRAALTADRLDRICELMAARRRQLGFRLLVAAGILVCFSGLLGLAATLSWAGAYLVLQAVERTLFRPSEGYRLRSSGLTAAAALTLLTLNGLVFGSLAILWPLQVGVWGMTCGGLLLAGALLNTVTTGVSSGPAFLASAVPFGLYLAAQPPIAARLGAGPERVQAIAFAALVLFGTAVQLWRTAHGAHTAERRAREALGASEREAKEARNFLDAIFETAPTTFIVKSAETGRFLYLNRAGERLLGGPRGAFLGRTDEEIFGEVGAAFARDDAEALTREGPLTIEAETLPTAEGPRTLRTTKLPIRKDGRLEYLLVVAEDVTEARAAERALTLAKEEAESANRAKSAFLATVSHEIRTPLNGILGMTQAMLAEARDGPARERLTVVRDSGETLLALLNDILDLSKIESGKLELSQERFDLSPLVEGAAATFAALAREKGLRLRLEIAPDALGRYLGDPRRLRQILHNLLSNALKFTDAGEVAIAARRTGAALEIAVRDTGVGIPADLQERLFRKFEQVDASMTRRAGGTGLGLAICRDLAGLMGGEVALESVAGAGSTFTLRLPLERVGEELGEAAADPDRPDGGLSGLRVLAAEDNPTNQLVLRALLQPAGVEPTLVGDGAAALEAVRTGAFDLILMDMRMPVMDGLEATRAIRRLEAAEGRSRTPILALTANAMAHQVLEYEAAGVDGFVAKPIRVEELFAALQETALGLARAAA